MRLNGLDLNLLVAPDALRIDPFPVPVPPLVEAFWWHPDHAHDAGHQWFREETADVAATLQEPVPTGPVPAWPSVTAERRG